MKTIYCIPIIGILLFAILHQHQASKEDVGLFIIQLNMLYAFITFFILILLKCTIWY